MLAGGGYAEHVAVPAGQVMPIPAGVDLVDAAGLPEVACTVWSTVVRHAGLAAGELLLVHGGSGGVGTHAIQVGRAMGARVATTASAARLARCAELGAQILIDLGVRKMRLLTNNPKKVVGVDGYGLHIVERVPIQIPPNQNNRRYLRTKKDKLGHLLDNMD